MFLTKRNENENDVERTNFCTGLFAGATGYYFAGNFSVGGVMPEIECKFDCPHCGESFVMDQRGIYIDNVEDECVSQCIVCNGLYQLRCVSVEVEMEALIVTAIDTTNKDEVV